MVRMTATALGQCEVMARSLDHLVSRRTELDSTLLARAFRGELVPQDPSDEPADVMLARLRAAPEPAARPSGVRATKKGRKKSVA